MAKWRGLTVAAVVGLLVLPAKKSEASLIQYNSPAAFTAATLSTTTIDFNGIAAAGSFASYGAGPLTLSGVTFTTDASMFVIDPAFYGSSYSGGGFLNADYNPSGVNTITAALPSATTAFAFDFGGLMGAPVSFTLLFSNGDTATITTNTSIVAGALTFVGFTSSTPFTSVQFRMPDSPEYNAIDNVRFGAAAGTPVPEPASMILFGTGLAGLVARRRQKRARLMPHKLSD